MRYIFVLVITLLLLACGSNEKKPAQQVTALRKLKKEEGKTRSTDSVISGKKHIIGKVISSDDDSTLLTLLYGSCLKTKTGNGYEYYFVNGPQDWNNEDSVHMKVAERFENGSTQLVFIRGELAISEANHNHFMESILLMEKTTNGWKVNDAIVDELTIDYFEVIKGEKVFNNYFMIIYKTSGTYAGGVGFGSENYILYSRNRLNIQQTYFITARSNTATEQCFPENGEQLDDGRLICNCYEAEGEVKYHMDKQKNCLVFNYSWKHNKYECGIKNPTIHTAAQTWMMNTDTSFQSAGDVLEEYNEFPEKPGKINLSEKEIRNALSGK